MSHKSAVHKNKRHATSLNPPAAVVGNKCDEVDSKAEASVEKEQARNSSVQNALFDEPILRNGSIEENLPTSVPSVEPKVHDQTVEVQDAVELPTSIPSVEPRQEDKNDPKGKDEDKTNSEDDETQSTEKRGVCSETSEQEIAHDYSRTQENVTRIYCEM